MTAHLAVLQVVLPLLAGPVAMLVRHRHAAWTVAVVASAGALVIALLLLEQVLTGGPIRYAMGNFAQPIGIEFRIDHASVLLLIVVSAISTLTLLYGRASIAAEVETDRQHLFWSAWLLCLAGLLGIVATGDAFNLFVFLEISSFAMYALIAAGRDRRALTASFQYLIMGTVGATFYLIGVAALYAVTGTLNMQDLAVRLAPLGHLPAVKMGFAFIAVGLSLKLALFPLHLWMPSAYAYGPTSLTAFLSGTATKVAAYALLRAVFGIFGVRFSFDVMAIGPLLLVLSVLGLFVASTVAIFQTDLRRLLAYSSVGQIGYIMLGASYANAQGLSAAMLHVFNHALIKPTLFMAVGALTFRGTPATLQAMRGAGRVMPWTVAAAVIGGLSLIGVPLTAGFTSKWQLTLTALQAGDAWVVAAIVVSSLLAVAYIWRLVEVVYLSPRPADAPPLREAPVTLLVPLWVLVVANLWFGVNTDFSLGLAQRAAAALLVGLP